MYVCVFFSLSFSSLSHHGMIKASLYTHFSPFSPSLYSPGEALKFASKTRCMDRDIMMAAVAQDGDLLDSDCLRRVLGPGAPRG